MRGIEPKATEVREEFSITEGRMLQFGTNEIVVGRAASRQYAGLTVGSTVKSGQVTWTVVGIFERHCPVPQVRMRRLHHFRSSKRSIHGIEIFAEACCLGSQCLNLSCEHFHSWSRMSGIVTGSPVGGSSTP